MLFNLAALLTLQEMSENRKIPTNYKAQMEFNTWSHVPVWLWILLAVRDLCVLCSAAESRQDWVGSFMGCKINPYKFLVRDATSSGISRAHGLTCYRH